MGGFKCSCNNVIRKGEIPNANEWLIISDIDFDKYMNPIDPEVLYREMISMFKCRKCGSLWIFWDGFKNPPKEYVQLS